MSILLFFLSKFFFRTKTNKNNTKKKHNFTRGIYLSRFAFMGKSLRNFIFFLS